MNKQDIAHQLAIRTGLRMSEAQNATESLFQIVSDAFTNGEDIFLRGFGTFKVVQRKAKRVRNITKGTHMVMPAHNTVKFIPSNLLTIKQ